MPRLTPEDMSQLADMLRSVIHEVVKGEVAIAVAEIPYRVQQELQGHAYAAVRKAVQRVVADNIHVTLEMK